MIDIKNYQPKNSSRVLENIEWSITYTFNSNDRSHPRALLIGDSICNGYQGMVRERLSDRANITFWASSKCVTDPNYFRELEFILDSFEYDFISFNNGLHSLVTPIDEWETAYNGVIDFIRAKKPDSKLSLTLCTPLNDKEKTAKCIELNKVIKATALKKELPLIDLFEPMLPYVSSEFMNDAYHYKAPAVSVQADIIAAHIDSALQLTSSGNQQLSSETGPSGALK